jgi:hypothetical protein
MRSRSFACSSFGLRALGVNFFRIRMASPLRPLYRDQSLHYALSSPLGVGLGNTEPMSLGPEHDWSSHGCDAFGLMAVVRSRTCKGNSFDYFPGDPASGFSSTPLPSPPVILVMLKMYGEPGA